MRNKNFILLVCSVVIVCIVISVCFIIYFNNSNKSMEALNSKIYLLENGLNFDQEKIKELEKQLNEKDKKIDQLKKSDPSYLHEQSIQSYNWLSKGDWNKVTLTDITGETIDITNHELFLKIKDYLTNLNTFRQGISVNGSITSYTYNFYFENGEDKTIAVSFDGDMGKLISNKMLYDLGIALMPVDKSIELCNENVNYAIANTEFFILDNLTAGYDINTFKYIMLSWIPENAKAIDFLPDDIGEPDIVFKGYYQGKISYVKLYNYGEINSAYMECYFDGKSIYYENIVKNNDFTINHVLGMSL